jgi:hypothetical protein
MSAQTAVERFFTAFYTGDEPATRDAVTSGFTMLGPFATVHNVDELIQLSAGLMSIARGHRVLQVVTSGDDVAVLYEIAIQGPREQGWMAIGGWFTADGDRLVSGRVIYDSATFDAIVAPS